MRDIDADALRAPYPPSLERTPDDRRLNAVLGLEITSALDLADAIFHDLDFAAGGVGWWRNYRQLGRQERIFISDHLLSCARTVYTNISESCAYRLEFDSVVKDFQAWVKRGLTSAQPVMPFPENLYEELSYVRVSASLTGIFRAFASSLDCLGACIVGTAGLPVDIVRTDLNKALESLKKSAQDFPRLGRLAADLARAEADAGPSGWIGWLLAMRHMLVHRGRRTITFSGANQPNGEFDAFSLVLPRAPELTEVQGVIYAGGQIASSFEAPADLLLTRLSESTRRYLNDVTGLLLDLWNERKSDTSLIAQPAAQWRQPSGLINPVPVFNGFELGLPDPYGAVRSLGVSDETGARMRAAGITVQDINDVRPSPDVWW